jgi:hypothetical protein
MGCAHVQESMTRRATWKFGDGEKTFNKDKASKAMREKPFVDWRVVE